MNDHQLTSLLSATPSRCIVLLEDIDCAFPSREDEDDDEDEDIEDQEDMDEGSGQASTSHPGMCGLEFTRLLSVRYIYRTFPFS